MSIKFGILNDRPDLLEDYNSLTQGDKIKFKWYGNSELIYSGRIELSRFGDKYFVNEHNYSNPVILESMRFYNRLMPFEDLTYFEKCQ